MTNQFSKTAMIVTSSMGPIMILALISSMSQNDSPTDEVCTSYGGLCRRGCNLMDIFDDRGCCNRQSGGRVASLEEDSPQRLSKKS